MAIYGGVSRIFAAAGAILALATLSVTDAKADPIRNTCGHFDVAHTDRGYITVSVGDGFDTRGGLGSSNISFTISSGGKSRESTWKLVAPAKGNSTMVGPIAEKGTVTLKSEGGVATLDGCMGIVNNIQSFPAL